MINTRTNQFETALTKLIEQSQLPPVNVRLVLQSVVSQMAMLEQQVMAQERAAAEREAKEQEKAEAEAEDKKPTAKRGGKPNDNGDQHNPTVPDRQPCSENRSR